MVDPSSTVCSHIHVRVLASPEAVIEEINKEDNWTT
jgi:hypothetical protein